MSRCGSSADSSLTWKQEASASEQSLTKVQLVRHANGFGEPLAAICLTHLITERASLL